VDVPEIFIWGATAQRILGWKSSSAVGVFPRSQGRRHGFESVGTNSVSEASSDKIGRFYRSSVIGFRGRRKITVEVIIIDKTNTVQSYTGEMNVVLNDFVPTNN